ncbi:hypothetical protein [Streptomyces sp. NRRL S-646]|uniref:hypothetical protein n=1 Tax=Streptomyces sp. NRRL S-646 TaxID=1463917 RepID=UPI000AA91BB2|nr:hypothetical protein [Streptomyces sp. NRRL S-646]
MNRWLRLTLLGVGAMNSPRFAPAGLLLRCRDHRILFDGGPGADPPPGPLDAWLVTDEQAELRSALRRGATARGVRIRAGDLHLGAIRLRCIPVAHTSHPAYAYRIETGELVIVWAPEFWEFPAWAAGADLMFAEAAARDRPIRFPRWRRRSCNRAERRRTVRTPWGTAAGPRPHRPAEHPGHGRRAKAAGGRVGRRGAHVLLAVRRGVGTEGFGALSGSGPPC